MAHTCTIQLMEENHLIKSPMETKSRVLSYPLLKIMGSIWFWERIMVCTFLLIGQNHGNRWENFTSCASFWFKNSPYGRWLDHFLVDSLDLGWYQSAKGYCKEWIWDFKNNFKVMSGADGYLVSYRSFDGIRFSGQGEFIGQNQTITLRTLIFGLNQTESTLRQSQNRYCCDASIWYGRKSCAHFLKLKNGLNRITWDLKADGVAGLTERWKKACNVAFRKPCFIWGDIKLL